MFNNLPKSWEEISLATYQDILIELKKDQLNFSKQIEILSILAEVDMDDEVWDNMDINDVTSLLSQVEWLFKTHPSTKVNLTNKNALKMETITLGEFIDLEHFFKNEYESNLHIILAILLRQQKEDEWGNIIQQKYDGIDIYKEGDKLLNESINNMYGALDAYITFRTNFLNSYAQLFNPAIELSEEEIEQQTEEDLEDIAKADKMDAFSWEFLIHNLTNGDITKYEEVLNLPLVFIFNQISFRKLFKLE